MTHQPGVYVPLRALFLVISLLDALKNLEIWHFFLFFDILGFAF